MAEPKVLNKYKDVIPPDAIYVGRPTKWGNPFAIRTRAGITKERERVMAAYEEWIFKQPDEFFETIKRELRGHDLVCYCAPKVCHADILLAIANE